MGAVTDPHDGQRNARSRRGSPANPAPSRTSLATLLLLVDGRLPSGGHAHSGGIEAAVADGRVGDPDALERFLQARLYGVGCVDAAFAAAAASSLSPLYLLEEEARARCASPALRRASSAQGRGLLRAAGRIWPHPELEALRVAEPETPMWPVVLGIVARSAGLQPDDAALAAAHGAVTGPAWAAVRLLGLDPFAVVGVLARLADAIDEVAARATAAAMTAITAAELPAFGSPLLEIAAEHHANWEVRLFVS